MTIVGWDFAQHQLVLPDIPSDGQSLGSPENTLVVNNVSGIAVIQSDIAAPTVTPGPESQDEFIRLEDPQQ